MDYTFEQLKGIVVTLRGSKGCAWDKAQTHKTLIKNLIEECFELVDALEQEHVKNTLEELGDVLLQVLLHAQIASEKKNFSIEQIINELSKKLIRRHPHVFSNKKAATSEEAHKHWIQAKEKEKSKNKLPVNFNIPKHLPSQMRAQKIGRKMGKEGYDWKSTSQALDKIQEEFYELTDALKQGNEKNKIHEIGDLLYVVTQVARLENIQAEEALRVANRRIEKRYFEAKKIAKEKNKNWLKLSEKEKESFWEEAKSKEI